MILLLLEKKLEGVIIQVLYNVLKDIIAIKIKNTKNHRKDFDK
jgi:hypothetical protein